MIDKRNAALCRFAISITALTIAGAVWLGFEDSWLQPVVALATAYALELVLETLDAWSAHRPARYRGGASAFVHSLLPAHITGLSIALLLYPNSRLWAIAFATAVGIASKFLFRVPVGDGRRHFLNPSNLGISVTLLLFPWVGISPPYQFTEYVTGAADWILPAIVLAAGTMLNAKLTGKMPLILAWVAGFAAQACIRWSLFGTSLVSALLPMTGLVFVLYTNYMITDPGTSPFARRPQIVFGAAVAAAYGALVSFHVVFGMFFGLTIVTMLRGGAMYAAHRAARVPVPAPLPARAAP